MDISYHFHKIRLKCETFSPTFAREKGPMSCLSRENHFFRSSFKRTICTKKCSKFCFDDEYNFVSTIFTVNRYPYELMIPE